MKHLSGTLFWCNIFIYYFDICDFVIHTKCEPIQPIPLQCGHSVYPLSLR